MSATDFFELQPDEKLAWGHKTYDEYIEQFYFSGMLGQGEAAIIDHITELSKNNKGESGAWLHLVSDVHGGGVFGDNTLEGRERSLEASWVRANFDQIRNGFVTKGRVSEQKSVINTRKQFRKKNARWLADSMEDMAILTASGIGYGLNTDGSPRLTPAGQDPWTDLEFAADVTAPSANRYLRVDATNVLDTDGNSNLTASDTLSYAVIPELEAAARNRRLTPLRVDGEEYFVWLVHTNAMARLWRDADFRSNVRDGDVRGSKNPLFRGAKVTMNNLVIKPYLRTFTTMGAASGSKWGAGGAVNGSRSLLLGAQALGHVDLGPVNWEEDTRDFRNRWALAIDKMAGWMKPKFKDSRTGTVEDYGVIAVDHAL